MISTIKRINAALARAGRTERLVRNLRGGSYYYLTDGDVECSIYVYRLAPDDFEFAANVINEAFLTRQLPAPISTERT